MFPVEAFSPSTREWFCSTFAAPTEIQRRGWEPIARGHHTLLVGPTGSGKTLAAFLAALDGLMRSAAEAGEGVRVVYVSPLKALVYDVERNLQAPLTGIRRSAECLGEPWRDIRVDIRTGDTSQRERQRQLRGPADILVTTPESLFLLLGSRARETLRSVRTVIVDEIHALAADKRGVHLSLSLERLAELTTKDPQRVGLSATVRPLDEVARFLGGMRRVEVVDASTRRTLEVTVSVPVADMERIPSAPPEAAAGSSMRAAPDDQGVDRRERGIWPAIYPALLEEVRTHRTTIIFVNSRGLCERVAQRLNELAGEPLARAHHGSVAPEERTLIEEALKGGTLRAIVATSSLELGIDMGAVERVLLVESPGSVARGIQRIGRASHHVGGISSGRIFPKFRGDLLECAVIAARMERGEIEAIKVPQNALDVLAQQIVAMCCDRARSSEDLAPLVRRAYPYRRLSTELLNAVIEMLSGSYPTTDFADLRPLLSWDRAADRLTPRRGTAMLTRLNAGTISDRGHYAVHRGAQDGPKLGELDEEMVFETRPGDNIVLGATTWRVEQITRDRVIVSDAPGEPGKLPFWHGAGPTRDPELGRTIGEWIRRLGALGRRQATDWLLAHTPLDRWAADNLAAYIFEQKDHAGTLPTDRAITVERFRDELGDWRVCILTPFGARIHAPWAMALERALSAQSGFETQLMYTDDGIVIRFADSDSSPPLERLLPDAEEMETLVIEQLAETALFAGLFRENAARALLLPRRRPKGRSPLWSQRLKAQQLLGSVERYPRFPIVLETYRQALQDLFDLPGLKRLLEKIHRREVEVVDVETPFASPFARSLVFAYVAAYIYEQDAPLAERKAQALTLDRHLLQELVGQAELRDLIDPQVLTTLEAERQRHAAPRRARNHDELHDVLRAVGDLSLREIAERAEVDFERWLSRLAAERRAAEIVVAGERRWIAADDAGLYRDALGAVPPPGLPGAFLHATEQPLERLAARYARTHGPFLTAALAARFGLLPAQAEPVLRALEHDGTLVKGEIRPGGVEQEWCDKEILQHLKRRTLAALRRQAAPVDAANLARFLPVWQGIGDGRQGTARLEEVIVQLEGLALPWSSLSHVILPQRMANFTLDLLDLLCAQGEVVWVGCGALSPRDGRIALYRRSHAAALLTAAERYAAPSKLHERILSHLQRQGASFLVEIESAVLGVDASLERRAFEPALWDLVWAGRITNDTCAPLRSLGTTPGPKRAQTHRRPGQLLGGGRWSLVESLVSKTLSETERVLARTHMLLERYGIVSREAALAEAVPGGFAAIYRVLKAMEEAGRVRRGYFIEGLSGSQFGHSGAVDRLRSVAVEEGTGGDEGAQTLLVLAAVDPANPYGALLPWPATNGGEALRPRRAPGAWVLLVAGRPRVYVAPGKRQLLTFAAAEGGGQAELEVAFRGLQDFMSGSRKMLVVEKIDGVPVRDSPHYGLLRACGFQADYRGLTPVPAVQRSR